MSYKKLKVGDGELTGAQVVGYLMDPQAAGDYYSEDGEAFMRWLSTPRARTRYALGDDVSRGKLRDLIEGVDPLTGQVIRHWGRTERWSAPTT